jgi:hypothetical protein
MVRKGVDIGKRRREEAGHGDGIMVRQPVHIHYELKHEVVNNAAGKRSSLWTRQ